MDRGILAAALALGLAVLVYFSTMSEEPNSTSAQLELPADPAGRRAAVRAAILAEGYSSKQADTLLGQGVLETANFTSKAFGASLSIWNRHVGSGKNGDWNGRVYMDGKVYDNDAEALAVDPTNAREHLRCFDDLRQCVRDMKGLLGLSLYADARAALEREDATGYATAIARGNGLEGFVGPVNTTKAQNYTAGLLQQYTQLGVA